MSQLIGEGDTPEVTRRFAVAATSRETAEASENVAERQPGSDAVHGAQRGHVMTPHVPDSHDKCGNQPTGKYASSLQRIETENLAPVVRVGAPVVDDVENFRSDDSGQDHENAKVPGIITVDALLLGIAHDDPKPDQDACSDQHAVSRQVETANLKKSGEHFGLDAPNTRLVSMESLAGKSVSYQTSAIRRQLSDVSHQLNLKKFFKSG